MGFRFNKRLKILPGIHLNLGLGGASISLGGPGASINVGRRGVFGSVGIPGTGLSYRQRLGGGSSTRASRPELPEGIDIQIQDGRIIFLDRHGRELTDEMRNMAVRNYRAQAEDLLDDYATDMNKQVESLQNVHLDAPAPSHASSISSYSIPKPVREEYASQDDFMSALMAWRAAKANYEKNGSMTFNASSLEQGLQNLRWPRETNISYQYSADGRIVVLDVDLPEIEDMPANETVVNKRELRIRMAPLSGKRIADLYSAHITSSVFRLAAAVFANSPAQEVRISGYTQRAGSTGHIQDEYVIAVAIDRKRWKEIDFSSLSLIDPENALRRFGAQMERTGRGSLRTVHPCPNL